MEAFGEHSHSGSDHYLKGAERRLGSACVALIVQEKWFWPRVEDHCRNWGVDGICTGPVFASL